MEERELQALVRRTKSLPDKTSTSRRSALKQLVEATRSSTVSLKTFAAKNIPEFFQDFPDAEEDAINAVYDLCEDQSSQVRMAGYNALVHMSRLEKKWVKRNADVLVQLLQSDDPNEVSMVRKALVDHLQFDPRVTLGVLCDQIIPPNDLVDPEELAMRDSLRTLVLSFITGELKKGQLVKYMPPGSEAEDALVDGLILAIPKLSESDAQVTLMDILLQLQFLDTPCSRGSTLSQSVLQRAKSALVDDHTNPDAQNGVRLHKTRRYLDILSVLFINKRQGNLEDLYNFYTPILGKVVFSSMPTEDQLLVLHHFVEALHASKTNDPSVMRLLNLVPSYFECLAKTDLSQASPQNTCILLLQRLVLATENGWTLPSYVLQSAQSLGRVVSNHGQGGAIHELLRSLAARRPEASAKPSSFSKTASAPPVPSPSDVSQELASSSSTISMPGRPSTRSRPPNSIPSLQGVKPLSRKQALDSDNTSHPTKKVKKGGGESDNTPSLLSRMGTSPSMPQMRPPSHLHPDQLGQQTHTPRLQRSESLPRVGDTGLSIKGAAKKEEFLSSVAGHKTNHRAGAGPRRASAVDSSLMDRLTLNGVVFNSHTHARRNKRRGVA
ncbi:apoptosis inhibitory protein 5-domain-containing protein [Lentinula aciculospora]|uniref:Apoptosis inhibitory protein 5-domain-containing protein n=1 Tax=Lentinula aciculospora TaxID=153920 RepID=A0A9W9AX71_9AGAR|nr:apoptosis inhibitory protein 5-domain-containing protein [Lentinula aciculospora]